ncbi:MAG: hypothetical protein IKX06_06255 [Clostridia bacterium]|nr:hypothetical protein [Clostridia bacterium]
MKHSILNLVAVAVTAILLCGTFFSCSRIDPSGPSNTDPAATLPPATPVQYKETVIPNGSTITTAARYANTVNGYYTIPNQDKYVAENLNARLTYDLSGSDTGFVGLESLTDPEGHPYVRDTMDVFIKTNEGKTLYASANSARANLYDQGYYYYNLHILDQTFSDNGGYSYKTQTPLPLTDCIVANDIDRPTFNDDGSLYFAVRSTYDPYAGFRLKDSAYEVKKYSGFTVTMKCSSSSRADLFYISGDNTTFTANEQLVFKLIPDGEFHTYYVPFDNNENLKGFLRGVRIDVGDVVGEVVTIKGITLADIDTDSFPSVKIDRNYNIYSDKLHESIRLVAIAPYDGARSFGTVTVLPKSTVRAYVVNDSAGPHYDLGEVDWESAAYAGFDVEDAGIFGIILGADSRYSGKLKVEENEDNYLITREFSLEGKKLKKGGEVFMTGRIYTDGKHDFSDFLQEAYYERFPLEIEVEEGSSKKSKFIGYDDLTGAYTLTLSGIGNFNVGYENPLDEHKVRFTVKGDSNARTVYVRGSVTTDGCLECGAVLDENDMLLPVKVEICKNFANDGEELFYTKNDSISYGIGVFPVATEPSKDTTLTFAALFEQWGNYRLKQISSIRFHTAYYHISLGVTETNCINFYYMGSRLPDHRGLSTIYWGDEKVDILDANGKKTGRTKIFDDQPQHANVGSHTFLQYTDSDGNFNSYVNQGRTVIASSGPTYEDITLTYLSRDGKVLQTYRHLEMPQTDENRAYYEISYEFLSDVSVNDVTNDLSLYRCDARYDMFGYLDENNKEVITRTSKDAVNVYKLGSDHPYFDSFRKTDGDPDAYTESDVSCNVAFLLDSCEATIGGKRYTGGYVVKEGNGSAAFTFDIKGGVTFKKGDVITLRCILMPWGDYFSENDANVRMVRINTLLNPIRITSESCATGDDMILPTVISADGKIAEFTVSGGFANVRDLPGYATSEYTHYKVSWERDYNVTVKVSGIKELGVPAIVERFTDGSEKVYDVASSLEYDGYMVEYAPDGTFSYTFVVTMTDAVPRTFCFTVS